MNPCVLVILGNASELFFANWALDLHVIVDGLWSDGLVCAASVSVCCDNVILGAEDVVMDCGAPGALVGLDELGWIERCMLST